MNEPAREVPVLAMRLPEAAKSLGLSERTVWTLAKSGGLPCVRVGKSILFPTDAIRDWLSEQARGGAHDHE